jgi:5'-nucleotidase (lipoprotein e(P4) family)
MMRVSRWVVILAAACTVACSGSLFSTPAPAKPAPPPKPAAPPEGLRWVQGSAEYVAAAVQAYRLATTRVEAEARLRPAGSWAVVLDADETVLNNTVYQMGLFRDQVVHSPERWLAWVKERAATPVPGAARFLTRVRELGGKIAIVTNRLAIECDDTVAVFKAQNLAFDAMLCRPDGAASDKNPRFRAVAAGETTASRTPIEVVAFVGDNILDFPSASQAMKAQGESAFAEFGIRWFLVPNPLYGSWQ